MKAARLYGKGDVRLVDIEKPKPIGGQVLIKIGAAGVCHSDLHLIDEDYKGKLPFTLGHENAGWVAEVGEGVTGFKVGDAVLVYGPWGCGHCRPCQESKENYCQHQNELGYLGGGLGRDGGMAEYMLVPSERLLLPLHELEPKDVAPLTDAALTPYHAIKMVSQKITPSSFILVQGIGGLGHMALQILKKCYSGIIIASDTNEAHINLARELGADYVINPSKEDLVTRILKITGSAKCDVIFDFVGVTSTLEIGRQVIGLEGQWVVVGLGGGQYQFISNTAPFGVSLTVPYWGSRVELIEVLDLFRSGAIHINIESYSLDDVIQVYEKLRRGEINGRAVLIP